MEGEGKSIAVQWGGGGGVVVVQGPRCYALFILHCHSQLQVCQYMYVDFLHKLVPNYTTNNITICSLKYRLPLALCIHLCSHFRSLAPS